MKNKTATGNTADDRAALAEALRKLIAHTDALCEGIRQDPAGYDNWRRHHDLLVHYGALDGARDVLAKHGPAGPMLLHREQERGV